eukprot:9012981-Pyramimonas_sp.AAC.1
MGTHRYGHAVNAGRAHEPRVKRCRVGRDGGRGEVVRRRRYRLRPHKQPGVLYGCVRSVAATARALQDVPPHPLEPRLDARVDGKLPSRYWRRVEDHRLHVG